MTHENRDGRNLSDRSYFGIGVGLGMAVSFGVAMLTVLLVAMATSPEDLSASSERVAFASVPVETTVPPDAGGAGNSDATDGGSADSGETADDAELIAAGEDLAATCVACHSTNGTDGVGPTWSGLFGSERRFVDGSTATADRDYLLESIIDPGAKVVEGFDGGIMPANFGDTYSAEDLEALVAYLASL